MPKLEIAQKLIELGFSMGVVQDASDLDQCPHLAARHMFVESGDSLGGPFRTVNNPIRLTESPETPANAPPLLGQNNEEIFCSIGGVTREELAKLREEGVV